MGSSHSRPRNAESSRPGPSHSSAPPRRHLDSLRRLSTLGRRPTKRDRAQSLDPSERDKRQRTGTPDIGAGSGAGAGAGASGPGAGSTPIEEDGDDPLALERTQTISTIREVLGDDWTPPPTSQSQEQPPTYARPSLPRPRPPITLSSNTSPGPPIHLPNGGPFRPVPIPPTRAQVTARRFRPTPNLRRRWSASYMPEPPIRGVGDDYIPLQRSESLVPPIILHHPDRGDAPIPRWYYARLEERLRILSNQRLEMRERLAQIQRAIDRSDVRASAAEAELARRRAGVAAASSEQQQGGTVEPTGERTPGAVLMIQGLAQMQTPPTIPPAPTRRFMGRRTAAREQASEQAQTIANLLTVASAATATTLWSSAEPRTQPNHMLQTLMARIRPRRPFSVRRNLGSYIYDAMGPQANHANASGGRGQDTASVFLDWLDSIHIELQRAMRDYNSDVPISFSRRNSDEPSSPTDAEDIRPSPRRRGSAPAPTVPPTSTPISSPNTTNTPLPDFHHQEGQTRPGSSPIVTDEQGSRRLNFFRAHVFPPPDPGDTSDHPIVPCVFVGVRSITHDPSQSAADLMAHPSFPFSDGQVPPSNTGPAQDGALPAEASAPTTTEETRVADSGSATQSRAQSLRSRLLALSPFSRASAGPTGEEESTTAQDPPADVTTPMSTFLVYVIGGNYPRNHPILSIPSLITGAPLTDEEMVLVGELMGQVKPPTATAEEVANSGLRVFDAGDIKGLVEADEILSGSAERCLVCLSDFEAGEECRLLGCRHVFHKDCVDQWIKVGRNACPACRTEAVDKSKSKSDNPTHGVQVGASDGVAGGGLGAPIV